MGELSVILVGQSRIQKIMILQRFYAERGQKRKEIQLPVIRLITWRVSARKRWRMSRLKQL